jgi:hypothetical protein
MLEPPEVVVRRAYLAANRGRFAEANGWVTNEVRRRLSVASARARRNVHCLRRSLAKVHDPGRRFVLVKLLEVSRWLRDPNFCWKAATRDKKIRTIKVTRVVLKGQRAKVYFTLRLANGRSVRENERLVYRRGRWFIG